MKLTNEHYTYWLQHKVPMPRWERERKKGIWAPKPISVHGLINRQISENEKSYNRHLDAFNLLNAMKHDLNRGISLVDHLTKFIKEWGVHPQYVRRTAYARKWLKRLA